jgi:hypothetical protein
MKTQRGTYIVPLGVLAGLLVVSATARAQQSSGSVRGLVADETGRPIGGALVSLHAEPAANTAPAARVAFNATASSGQDGSFSFASVPAGPYRLCARAPSSDLVNGCLWTPTAFPLQVAAGAATTAPAIVLRKGATLRIRMADPSNLIDLNAAARPLTVGAFSAVGLFIPSGPATKTGNVREYALVVPTGVAIRPSILAPGFQAAYAGGSPVDTGRGSGAPVTVADGATEHVIQVTVTAFTPGQR